MRYPTPEEKKRAQRGPGATLRALQNEHAELKREHEALARSHAELKDFFENITVPCHWVGPEGIIVRVNQAELDALGYTRDEYVGHHISDFHVDARVAEEMLVRLCRGETLRGFEARMRTKDGRIRDVLVDSSVMWEGDKFVHTRCVTRDITEQKCATEILQQSEERLRRQAKELEDQLITSGRLVSLAEITASMAHEFNNPLGVIMGFTQELLSETEPTHPHHRYLKIIEEESGRCEKIIKELLQFARPAPARRVPAEVAPAIQKSFELVAHRFNDHNHMSVVKNLDQSLPKIAADPQQFTQLLVNLYLNAADAMPQGGVLTIEAHANGELETAKEIVISVADTGMGINAEDLPRIFQPFFSVRKRRGLGLGLSVCDRIARSHGGRITVDSRPGAGTVVRVFWPISSVAVA